MESSPARPQQHTWKPPERVDELFSKTKEQHWSCNAPTAGSRSKKKLPKGHNSLQLYSMNTPNGQKVGILLEELGIPYDAHYIDIHKEEQFQSGFVKINPNSKIPVLVDRNGPNNEKISVFESNSILLYLAEKEKRFLPQDLNLKVEVLNWLFWQASGQGPFTGQFCHYLMYAPKNLCEARDYGVARYGMEVQRLCSVLDKHLANRQYMIGNEYSIVDIAIFPYFNFLRKECCHESGTKVVDFLNLNQYSNLNSWADRILEREAVIRGMKVCCSGECASVSENKATTERGSGRYEAKGPSVGGLVGGYKGDYQQHQFQQKHGENVGLKGDKNLDSGSDEWRAKNVHFGGMDTSKGKENMGIGSGESTGQSFNKNNQNINFDEQNKDLGWGSSSQGQNLNIDEQNKNLGSGLDTQGQNFNQQQGRNFDQNLGKNMGTSGDTKSQYFSGSTESKLSGATGTSFRENQKPKNVNEDFSQNRNQNINQNIRDNKEQTMFPDSTSNINRQQQPPRENKKRLNVKKQSNINQQQPTQINVDDYQKGEKMKSAQFQPKQQQQQMADTPHTKGAERKKIDIGGGYDPMKEGTSNLDI